jgi:sortase A
MPWARRFERFFWAAGILLLAAYLVIRIHGAVLARRDVSRFEKARLASAPMEILPGERKIDYKLWSPERIRAYQESLKQRAETPLAVLRIPKIGLEVPVLEGTDDFTLNRAVGHIAGTPRPGEGGNIGIAGHRDGFFRGLKDMAPGDELELETKNDVLRYRIADTRIVRPQDVEVLDPTAKPTLTLVTCYPFYFVGSAPQRFIIRAVRDEAPRQN